MVRRRRQRWGGETNRKRPAQSGPISSAASAQICKGHQKRPSNPAPGNTYKACQPATQVRSTHARPNEPVGSLPVVAQELCPPKPGPNSREGRESVCGSWGTQDAPPTGYLPFVS
ncbi:hypothetical protein CMEL01_03610 [Colletotrichum melonis]|uniref:Uncharacterized protein n=1 Tax=Colletotrichum melonis TaxID=1209925 RepID=A0AAI9UAN3_9PEZI|nr:hypothetical protein CMEL01_03610 [Colletotrichum melonis]